MPVPNDLAPDNTTPATAFSYAFREMLKGCFLGINDEKKQYYLYLRQEFRPRELVPIEVLQGNVKSVAEVVEVPIYATIFPQKPLLRIKIAKEDAHKLADFFNPLGKLPEKEREEALYQEAIAIKTAWERGDPPQPRLSSPVASAVILQNFEVKQEQGILTSALEASLKNNTKNLSIH